jgi:hypothetical protein
MTYIFTINFVLPTSHKMLAHIIPTMEWTQGLFGTLEVLFDWQAFLVRRVLIIIELSNVVHPDTVFKWNKKQNSNEIENEIIENKI